MQDNDIFSSTDRYSDDGKDGSFDLNAFSSANNLDQIGLNGKKRRKKRNPKREAILRVCISVFLLGVITVSIVMGSFIVYAFTAVDGTMNENLNDLKLNFTTTVYTQTGENGEWEEYQRLHGEFNRIWVSYDPADAKANTEGYTGIPQNLVDAYVAVEDKRFYKHQGVDWKRTVSAFANLFLHFYSSNQGGSTITQQLVKNLTDDRDTKATRKVREIMRARYLESHYSKDTIIECYLNTIPMGHGTYGVEVAANYYFDKSVSELTLAECASLASITKAPSTYSPQANPQKNKERRETVLKLMLDQGYITETEYNNALSEEIVVVGTKDALNETEVNSYYIDALIRQVTKDLAEKYGYDEKHAASNFYTGGYKIYTTMDPEYQQAVETVFNNAEKYGLKGKNGAQLQGAMTLMDYNGHVLAMAGGIGEKQVNLGMTGFNRATDAIRQPGSTMKPIGAYAPAIEDNLITYSTIVEDKETKYGKWKPVNWYGGYRGKMTVQYALERSNNTIPVQLVNTLKPQTSYDFLTKNLGITTLTSEDINLSPLGMGGTNGGLTTLESAAAYAVFGNGGMYYEPTLYTKVCDQHGKVILEYDYKAKPAISEDTATVMNHLLQQVVYGSQGTGTGAKKYVPNMRIYAKTGTSNDSNDLWFVGGTPYYVASVWCGYDQQQTISKSSIAQTMWGEVMSQVHSGLKSKNFENSSYASCYYYCTETGQLATDACPSKATGWYKKGNVPSVCKTHNGSALSAPNPDKVDTYTPSQDKKPENNDNQSGNTQQGNDNPQQGNDNNQQGNGDTGQGNDNTQSGSDNTGQGGENTTQGNDTTQNTTPQN